MKSYKLLIVLAVIFSALLLTVITASAQTINVCDYGADGTALTDQTEFFKAAIAAAQEGDTVFVPNGTYAIAGITLPTGISFKGESRDGAVLQASSADSAVVSLRLGSNITVSDLTIDGNMTAKYCLYFKSGDDNTADNVKMCNLPHKGSVIGLYINGRCRRSTVRNCLFENIGVRPSGDENEDKGTGICIYGNSMFSYNHTDTVLIENNYFNLIGRTAIAGDYVSDVIVRGNTIKNTGYVIGKGLSIEIYGASCRNCIIENNTVDHWMSIHGQYHAIRNNRIGTDFFEDEDYYKRYAIENIATNIVYSNNEISGGNKYGILDLSNGGNVLYTGISVANCTQAAYSAGACSEFGGKTRRYFYDCSFNDTIKSDTLSIYPSSSGIGVEVNNKVSSFVFDNVEMSGNGRYGMQSKGISGLFELKDCSITANGGTGFLFGLTNPFEFTNLTVHGNGKEKADGSFTGDGLGEPTAFANAAPTADFSADKEQYYVGDTAVFTNTSVTAAADILFEEYLWELGTGLPLTSRDASVTFSQAGTYSVSLVVWDSSGRGDIIQKNITVIEFPPVEESTQPQTEEPHTNDSENDNNKSFIDILREFFERILNLLRSLFLK